MDIIGGQVTLRTAQRFMSECPSLVPCDRPIIESTSSFPDNIPSGTAVPHWATLSSAEFDATTAEAAGGKLNSKTSTYRLFLTPSSRFS